MYPWSEPAVVEEAEEEAPVPSICSSYLGMFEVPYEERLTEYLSYLDSHVSKEFVAACPRVISLLKSQEAVDVFVCNGRWGSKDVEPVRFNFKEDMPTHWHSGIARIHPDLLAPAKKELDHLFQHYLVPSDAPFSSALVIAPKYDSNWVFVFVEPTIELSTITLYLLLIIFQFWNTSCIKLRSR